MIIIVTGGFCICLVTNAEPSREFNVKIELFPSAKPILLPDNFV